MTQENRELLMKEITEEEYNEAFCKMVEDIKKEHFKYNNSIIHCNYYPDEANIH